jgi:hypothetical protein
MQKQWTIEARADFSDQSKNEMITKAINEAAVHVHAVMALLSDGQKPLVVAFSDDFFKGHEDISLHEDTLGKAIKEHAEVGENVSDGNGGVSSEMMAALSEMNSAKKAP